MDIINAFILAFILCLANEIYDQNKTIIAELDQVHSQLEDSNFCRN